MADGRVLATGNLGSPVHALQLLLPLALLCIFLRALLRHLQMVEHIRGRRFLNLSDRACDRVFLIRANCVVGLLGSQLIFEQFLASGGAHERGLDARGERTVLHRHVALASALKHGGCARLVNVRVKRRSSLHRRLVIGFRVSLEEERILRSVEAAPSAALMGYGKSCACQPLVLVEHLHGGTVWTRMTLVDSIDLVSWEHDLGRFSVLIR